MDELYVTNHFSSVTPRSDLCFRQVELKDSANCASRLNWLITETINPSIHCGYKFLLEMALIHTTQTSILADAIRFVTFKIILRKCQFPTLELITK